MRRVTSSLRSHVRRSQALAAVVIVQSLLADGWSQMAAETSAEPGVPTAAYSIAEKFVHQQDCFTEGLLLNGSQLELFESCGQYRQSSVRRSELRTGKTLQVGGVPREIFGEGLSILGERMYLLTYEHHVVLEYNAATMQEVRRHAFPYGEGWGLTTDGCDLFVTTGSEYIYRLRPEGPSGLKFLSKVKVTIDHVPVRMLNEVEYVTPKIWVNQWGTNWIFRVDPATGIVELKLDLRSLYPWTGEATPNGIAYSASLDPNVLLVTGKMWPHMFALKLSTADLCGGEVRAPPEPLCEQAPLSACWRRSEAKVPPSLVAVAPTEAEVRQALEFVPPAPLPLLASTAATAGAALLAATALGVPLFMYRYRQRYISTMSRMEMASL